MAKAIQFSEVTLKLAVSSRGGGIEIDLTRFGFSGQKMSAYCNSLGGGMLGKICANNTIEAFQKPCTDKQKAKLDRIAERLKKYYHSILDEEFDIQSYEVNQNMSVSAY